MYVECAIFWLSLCQNIVKICLLLPKLDDNSLSGACQVDVAVSTSSRHADLSIARRLVVARPKLIVLHRPQTGLSGSADSTMIQLIHVTPGLFLLRHGVCFEQLVNNIELKDCRDCASSSAQVNNELA